VTTPDDTRPTYAQNIDVPSSSLPISLLLYLEVLTNYSLLERFAIMEESGLTGFLAKINFWYTSSDQRTALNSNQIVRAHVLGTTHKFFLLRTSDMNEQKSSVKAENRLKEIVTISLAGAAMGFFLAGFEGYFRGPIVGSTRAASKEVLGSIVRYSSYGAALCGSYALIQEFVVGQRGQRDLWAPLISGSIVGLVGSAAGNKCTMDSTYRLQLVVLLGLPLLCLWRVV
jgi:ABC-type Fe3+-siderophore transport system permease subunit